MKRVMYFTIGTAIAAGISAAAAQTGDRASPNVQSMTGVVKALSASSLTVERGGKDMMFGVNASTRVFATGRGGARGRDLVFRTPPPKVPITDFIKAGDRVTVKYRQSGRTLDAVEVRVGQQ